RPAACATGDTTMRHHRLAQAGTLAVVILAAWNVAPSKADELRAGAVAERLEATDDMIIARSHGPRLAKGQEGELRGSAVVVAGPDGGKACLVACDVVVMGRDILDPAARQIADRTGIPFDQILINATHTHHAPSTAKVHGYGRDEAFTRQL